MAHQPLGKGNWLRGDHHLGASTAYEAWRGGPARRGSGGDDDGGRGVGDACLECEEVEGYCVDGGAIEEGRTYNPEEVDNLVSLITEEEEELTVSSSDDAASNGAEEDLARDSAPLSSSRQYRRNPLNDAGEGTDGAVIGDEDALQQQATANKQVESVFGDCGSFELELSASSHMVVVDRVVQLELEKEKAARRLKDWASCAGELRTLFESKSKECEVKDKLISDLTSRLTTEVEKKNDEIASLRKALCQQKEESDKVAKGLKEDVVLKEELLKDSKEHCRQLRSALMDAELELDRQQKALTPGGVGGAEGQSTSGSDPALLEGSNAGPNHEETKQRLDALSKKDERIMKQEFELQRSRVVVYQQRQQIQSLTAELSRLHNQSVTLPGSGQQEEEKGRLMKELAHQIEEGSREIKIIQNQLLSTGATDFSSED
ncbi:hypothetical protein HOP50_14g72660 [Chloropicon primus]|nr:hypothetical protein A3770_14p72470 [Chloropicon primus]UPR03935.1 hypothetical protein HOP50_14g72660 [Chloropicon primus]|eukprot:QDZ24729.1 hypothetical protein A3770_14p72470 [Chloropicon primus]